jgi:hypothetical protein
MLLLGIALLAISIGMLWMCLPDKGGAKPWLVRGGTDVLVAIVIVTCMGLGIIALIAGVSQT